MGIVMPEMQGYLQKMVARSSAALLGKDGKSAVEGLLFLGNPQLVFPRMLFDDPVLEPVDRNVWAAIKLHAADGDSVTAFPSYGELMLRCNVGSKATLSRSISILRSTRWLTVCKARLRDAQGRVRGSIYALHDEPLQLVETLGLDAHYLEWLEATAQGRQNPHSRAIAIADKVLRDMRRQLQSGEDITDLESPLTRRARAAESLSLLRSGRSEGQIFSLSTQSCQEISSREYLRSHPTTQVQKLYLVETTGVSTVSVPRSSNSSQYLSIRKNTTTTDRSTATVLAWPDLDPNNRALVRMQLETVPNQHHQPILDALAAKLAAIASGVSPKLTYGILPYTRKLCELAVTGKLNPVSVTTTVQPTKPVAVQQEQGAEAMERELKILECQLSNLSSEVRQLEQLSKAGNYVPAALELAKQQWRAVSQRHMELKHRQGRAGTVLEGKR